MHLYTFPSQDSFITNISGLASQNFGLTEILKIGAAPTQIIVTSPTSSQFYDNQYLSLFIIQSFYGTISGSFTGSSDFFSGSIISNTSSINTSYFSGSINNIPTIFSGSIISSSINGNISGSLLSNDTDSIFSGSINNLNGCIFAWITGYSQIPVQSMHIANTLTVNRALIEFDLNNITNQIENNNITNFKCFLKLKTCEAKEVPIQYTIYALPISQSWTMGNGYFSDGGSTNGVSWLYKDGVMPWDNSTSSVYSYVSLNSTSSAGGGGTWYSSSICSQSFNYETSDLNLDITSIVNQWVSGSIPNNGILLISSAEIDPESQGYLINYFSEDTNTIYSPILDFAWNDVNYITASIETGSVDIRYITASISGVTNTSSYFISNVNISGSFSGSAGLTLTLETDPITSESIYSSSGIILATGYDGNILNIPIVGSIIGTVSLSSYGITGSCGCEFNTQLISASFIDGIWSGSYFTGYYLNNMVKDCMLVGSYTSEILSGLLFSATSIENSNYYTSTISNLYFTEDLIGNISFYSSNSASFSGYFTDGLFNGSQVNLQFTGNIYTSSFYYTSSINYISNTLTETNIDQPFVINIENLNYTYQLGNIIYVYIDSHKKYPKKTFERGARFEEYLLVHYLPSSSYYAIRDNVTQEMIIDFDEYTQLSCDYKNGNYFVLDTSTLFPDREYQILIKSVDNGSEITIDTGKKLRIVK